MKYILIVFSLMVGIIAMVENHYQDKAIKCLHRGGEPVRSFNTPVWKCIELDVKEIVR